MLTLLSGRLLGTQLCESHAELSHWQCTAQVKASRPTCNSGLFFASLCSCFVDNILAYLHIEAPCPTTCTSLRVVIQTGTATVNLGIPDNQGCGRYLLTSLTACRSYAQASSSSPQPHHLGRLKKGSYLCFWPPLSWTPLSPHVCTPQGPSTFLTVNHII